MFLKKELLQHYRVEAKIMKKLAICILVLLLLVGNFINNFKAEPNNLKISTEKISYLMPKIKTNNEKLEQSVVNLIAQGSKRNYLNLQQLNNFDFVGNKVRLEVILSNEEQLNSLADFSQDIEIENHFNQLTQVLIPIDQIQNLSKENYVQFIRCPVKGIPDVISEGVNVIGANLIQNEGYNGAGVKIAVIDLGFINYSTNPDLPPSQIKEAISFRADHDIECGEEHGCACAEIINDVAPQADLYLYNFETISELNDAVSHAIFVGVDIISFSIGFVGINDYNGIGYSEYGDVCSIVNNAQSQGILFVVSSGNEAQSHYEGLFSDGDGNNWHNFGSADEFLSLGYLSAWTYIHLALSWDDWPHSTQDYDLYVVDRDGYIVGYSEDVQDGTQPPVEIIGGYTTYSDYYYVAIHKYQATRNVHFELYSFYNDFYTYNHPESSLTCPADTTGAMTAGATYWQNDNLENFSSQGPTNDGRTKPNVTAPDGVSTYVYGDGNFYGTSAAAPHTAGAAALLLSVGPQCTADDLQNLLETKAVDLGSPGTDNLYGSGRIDVSSSYDYMIPKANFTYSPQNPNTSDIIQFTDTSTDSDGTIVGWSWKFGDGNTSTNKNPTCRYTNNGLYIVTLNVTDDDGADDAVQKTIIVFTSNNPPYTASNPSPEDNETNVPIINVTFTWSGGDPDSGDLVTYDIYFGISSSPPLIVNNQSATTYDLGTLDYSTKYYWKIVTWDDHGVSTEGPLWNFITTSTPNYPPIIVYPNPANGSKGVGRPPAQLNATIEDLSGDLLTVILRWMNHTGTWITLITYTDVNNGTYFAIPSENDWIWGNTTYLWSVNVTDGITWTNQTYVYTTKGSRYDVDNNNKVNFQDAGLVWTHRTSVVLYNALYDVNQDGKVNFQDAGLTWVHRD
jgi:PKD repeat protein